MKRVPDLTHAQLFLDDAWIDETTFVQRQWHSPRKFPDPVLAPEHPWERWCASAYGTILHWRGRFRMWYIPWNRLPRRGVCYAESEDGVSWEKPRLGLCDFDGSRENNIVIDGTGPKRYVDDLTVIDDPHDSEWPLKALYWEAETHDWTKPGWGIWLARSKDGIHWDRSPGLVLPHWIDRFNALPVKWNGRYVVYGRSADFPRGMGRNGRSIWRTESRDLVHWSQAKLVLERDPEDPVNMECYSLTAFPYENMVLGGLERMFMSPDRLDTELAWSHDGGWKWHRAPRRPAFLSPSDGARRWDDTWVSLPANAPIRHQGRLWFYYSGRSGAHGSTYPIAHGAIGLAVLRIDGFASLMAGERVGTVVTNPIRWPKADLFLNVDPRRDLLSHPGFCSGEVRVEVRDAAGKPIRGYTWADCVPFIANTINLPDACAPATWKRNKSLRSLAGRNVRLAFQLRDAHLYSFRAR